MKNIKDGTIKQRCLLSIRKKKDVLKANRSISSKYFKSFAIHCTKTQRIVEYIEVVKEMLLTYDYDIDVDEIIFYKAVLWSDLCLAHFIQGNIAQVEAAHGKALELSEQIHTSDNKYLTLLYET